MYKVWSTAIATLCLCSFVCGQQTRSLADIARESKAKSTPAKPCSSSTTNPAGTTTPPVTDLANEPDACAYRNGVTKLLAEGKFSELEQVAAVARSGKARFVGGGWKLYTFYQGVAVIPNDGTSQADWDSHFESLKRWLTSQPATVTPYVALAQFYLSDGWKARGIETADKVTPEGWRILEERAGQARAILNQAGNLKPKCPEWYHTMMNVAQAQGWDPEETKTLFDQAIGFEPEYYYFYQKVGSYLLPKWYGESGDLKRFAQESADRIGGKDGDILYWQIAAGAIAGSGRGTDGTDLSWLRIRRGYRALVEKYGETVLRENEMCYMAVRFKDPLLAQDLFARIGENWTSTWEKREYFDNASGRQLTLLPCSGSKTFTRKSGQTWRPSKVKPMLELSLKIL